MRLTNATRKAVTYACLNFHYAKATPIDSYSYNVFNDKDEWCGVIVFGPGANLHIAKPFGMCQGEVIELVRVALNGKQETTSQCLAAALKLLHKQAPHVKIVVSYADKDQEHAGIIYQATNWIYQGSTTDGASLHFIIHGKKVHSKSAESKGWVQKLDWLRKNIDSNATRFTTKGKHKYIFIFDKKLRKKYLKTAKPYPKNNTD